MRNKYWLFVAIIVALCCCAVVVILLSWVVAVLHPAGTYASLLSSSGLRWLLTNYVATGTNTILLYLLFLTFAAGALYTAGIHTTLRHLPTASYHERLAAGVAVSILLAVVAVAVVGALFPHSLLRGIRGDLLTGPYLPAIILLITVGSATASSLYIAIIGGDALCQRLFHVLTAGLRAAVPVVIIYFLAVSLVRMLLFVVQGM